MPAQPSDSRPTSRRGLLLAAGAVGAVAGASVASPAQAESQTIQSGPSEVGLTVLASGQGGSFQQLAGATGGTHALSCVCKATTGDNSALNVASDNPAASALMVTGRETGRGTVKIAHVGTSNGSDANASAISISVETGGTAAQGIFVDAPNGTSGALLQLRNAGQRQLRVHPDGRIQFDGPATVSPAAALPASPDGYLRFRIPDGRAVRVPYYLE